MFFLQLTGEEVKRLERQRANKRKWAQKERARSRKEFDDLKEVGDVTIRYGIKTEEISKIELEDLKQKKTPDHHHLALI